MSDAVPQGWARHRLRDLFQERKERGYEGLPIASVSIDSGLVLRSSLDRRVVSTLTHEEHALARKNDIAYNMMRMWQGACGLAKTDCVVSPAYVVMTPSGAISPDFALEMLKSPVIVKLLHAYSQGIVDDRLRLYPDAFGQIPVNLPPIEEQKRIAEILRSIGDAITSATAAAEQAKEARTHQLETLMALPGPMRSIEDVCRLTGGFGFPIKFQGKKDGVYPFAKVSDMNRPGNEVELVDAENYVDENDLRLLRAKPFPAGVTLFPKVGATLLTNKRRIAARELIVDNNVMAAIPTDISPWFLFYAFHTIDMADYVQPGAVPSVNQRTIGKIMIPVPVGEVQRDFVEKMRDLDRAIASQLAAQTRLIETKNAVSADLLSGRVRVHA